MKILVPVKEVGTVHDEFEIDGTDVDEAYLDYDINEWDEYAVEAAVQIAEEHEGCEVVSATVGPERSEETIRMVLAKGVDRAIRVWDDALATAEMLDVASKTNILAAVVESESPDLVLTGVQTGDDAFGATGVSLANALDYGWAAVVNQLDFDPDQVVAHVHRELEGGVEELTDVETPAVLTIQTGINEPRYASLRGIRQAQSKEIAELSLADLGLDPSVVESRLRRISMAEPETETEPTIFEGGPEETAAQLADLLAERGVGE